jgi:hypothetical protein
MDEDSKVAPADPAAEVKAMGKIADALAALEPAGAARVIRWAADVYRVAQLSSRFTASNSLGDSEGASPSGPVFTDLADLYAATSPKFEADKALVGAYWVQYGEGKAEFGSQEINTALKNLGHQIANITDAFDSLKNRKPAPVIQVKKSGTTRQARKTYRLTVAGKNAVEAMMNQG